MKIDWGGIVEGIRNRVIPPIELKEIIESTRAERMTICDECEWKRGIRCGKCGCLLDLKTSCLSCNCPILKWTQLITKEDDKQVKETLNGSN